MKKNLRSKILLCVLAGGVLAANTAFAAEYMEYTEAILGAEDTGNIYNSIKSNTGNNYTYTFTEDSVIKISGGEYGIAIGTNAINTDSITVAGANLNIDIVNEQLTTDANGYGISIGAGQQNKIIDMSNNNGYINVSTESGGDEARSYGVVFLDGTTSNSNKIDIGDSFMNLSAYNNANGKATAAGIYLTFSGNSHTVTMGDGHIVANAVSENDGAEAFGICDYSNNSNIQIGDVSMNISAEGNTSPSYSINSIGIMKYGTGFVKAGDGDMIVMSKLNGNGDSVYAHGIEASEGIVEKDAGNITVKATAVGNCYEVLAYGIYAHDGAEVTKKENGNITVVAQGKDALAARGVFVNSGIINVDIADVTTQAIGGSTENGNFIQSIGLLGRNDGEINFAGGSITAIADNEDAYVAAISAEGDSFINVNQGTENKVVINGDVNNRDNGLINLTLNTESSAINGAIDDNSANGINLTLANGAEWNNSDRSNVTNVSMNGGIISQNTDKYIEIENYSGNGEINFAADNIDNNGVLDFNNTGDVTIGTAEAGSVTNLSVNTNNTVDTINSVKANENLNAIANKIYYTNHSDGNITGSVKIAEGLITPEVSGDLLFYEDNSNGHTAGQGYVANVKQNSSTTTIDNIKNVAATAIVAWRQEDSTLSQRLGELRESDGGQGIWVRMSRGEFEYDGEYKNQYNFFQMGYDWAAGNWHYGAAVSHNDGQTTYTHGDGENRSTSLSLYGTWLGDKGHYADIVLKQGRLSNDFDIYTETGHTSGDYDAWGTSLSGEYGMKVDLDGGWYVTPQAQLTLMRIGGEDYTTNNGIKVNQDSLESAVGRVGFEIGKRISDSGSIYAKASLLHDFAGSADTYLSYKGLTNSYHQDIGDTWCEAGIGFNYKTSENSYVYADVVKTFGGDVETPWQWNAGMRWTF